MIINKIQDILRKYKNVVISGEEGVGKITSTLQAVQDMELVYYIGNPVDYLGKPRPKGYDKYINYIMSLKKDMCVIADEEILSLTPSVFSGRESVLIIDELYGRNHEQQEKIVEILNIENVKVFLITGCLKNIGRIVHGIDIVLMLTKDGVLQFDREFAGQICTIFKSETL